MELLWNYSTLSTSDGWMHKSENCLCAIDYKIFLQLNCYEIMSYCKFKPDWVRQPNQSPARQYLDGPLKGPNLKTIIWAWAPQFANLIINSLFIRKTRLIKDYMITDVYSTWRMKTNNFEMIKRKHIVWSLNLTKRKLKRSWDLSILLNFHYPICHYIKNISKIKSKITKTTRK